jgi:parvulin-like peptidyl-prolyl isomerase
VSANSPNVARRKRKTPPRRTPAIIEQREKRPWIFGWGADLDRRQREAIKERIALFAGITLAAVLVLLLGYGWYHDNITVPAERNRINNQTVAIVGSKPITYGYFKRVALFNKKQLDTQLQQLQQEQAQLSASKDKKSQAQLAQVQQQVSQIQGELSSLPSSTESQLIDDSTLLQRASAVGVSVSAKELNNAMVKQEQQAGGIDLLNKYITQGGLTRSEYETLVKAGLLQSKVQAKLARTAPHWQTEEDAQHILVSDKQKSLATRLLTEVKHGANFAALAKKYSKDTSSAKNGGDLGYAPASRYVTPFAKAVSTMKKGEIRLVHSQFGWHIIKLLGRKKVKLTGVAYQQAQQNAYSTWLTKEQDSLHIQHIMDVTKIPGIAETAPATGLSPGLGSVPSSPPSTSSSSGSTSSKSGKTGKSGSTSKSGSASHKK